MMTKGRRLYRTLLAAAVCAVTVGNTGMTAMASSTDYLDSLSTGVSSVLDGELTATTDKKSVSGNEINFPSLKPSKGETEQKDELTPASVLEREEKKKAEQKKAEQEAVEKEKKAAEAAAKAKAEEEKKKTADGGEKGTIVMANVKNSVNVRAEANEDSEKVGYLYADCGGKILDRQSGWTKVKSGELVGWVKDEFLIFGEKADAMANELGNLVVTIKADALRVRKAPNEGAEVYGMIAKDDELEVIEDMGGWLSVEYDKKTGYISKEYVEAEFRVDYGETVEAVKKREEKAAAEKAKLAEAAAKAKTVENRGAVAADVSDELLLAALIQCEAGNQPYEGQLAVGAVVMNRLRSGAYPNTINGVIYASGQFTPALNGKVDRTIAKGNVKASCIQAAQEALAGNSNVGAAMHFRRAGKREGIVIGNHVFW